MARVARRFVGSVGALVALFGAAGCQKAIHGAGDLYIWNGTEKTVEFSVKGPSEGQATLKFEQGQLFEELVVGDYHVTPLVDGVPMTPMSIKIPQNGMALINYGGAGCFARADVAGMYKRGKVPVRVLQTYAHPDVLDVKDEIAVKPGQRMPAEAPRLTGEMVYQRFVVIPCDHLEGIDANEKVAQFIRRAR